MAMSMVSSRLCGASSTFPPRATCCRRHQRRRLVIRDRFVRLVEFHADDLADAMFLHRHAVKHVRHADGALVVRDDDELRMRRGTAAARG